jgi:hypothetical protein
MRIPVFLAALAALSAIHITPLVAQPGKPQQVDKATADKAAYNMKLFISAMQSDKIPGEVKDRLFWCLYGNSMGKVGEAMDKVIVDNKGKINRTNADQMLAVMAGVCGYRPKPAAQPAPKR